MFSSVGWGELLVLLAAGLIILGPERLPGAMSWTMKTVRQVRDYATGATDQLKGELGPEFEDLRKPLSQLNELRGMTPRAVVTKHLLDGDDSLFKMGRDARDTLSIGDSGPFVKPVSDPVPEPRATERSPGDEPRTPAPAPEPGTPRRHGIGDWDAT